MTNFTESLEPARDQDASDTTGSLGLLEIASTGAGARNRSNYSAPTDSDQIRIQVVSVTADIAEEFLKDRDKDRPINETAVKAYMEALREGRWQLNGESILFDAKGRLIDGVQRLTAVTRLHAQGFDAKLPTFVIHGADPEILHTIDVHRRRSYRDSLRSRGEENVAALEGALIWLMRYKDGTMLKRAIHIPWARLDRILAANPGLRDVIKTTLRHPAKAIHESIRTPLTYMGYQVDRAATDQLLADLAAGNDAAPGSPGAVLYARLEAEADRHIPVDRPLKFAFCLQALNDQIRGKRSASYNWRPTGKLPYPELWNFPPASVRERKAPKIEVSDRAMQQIREMAAAKDRTWDIETITPELARIYIEKHNQGNRKIVRGHIDALKRDIAAGRFMLNYKPITFSKSERLLNGQHRLYACIEADTPIEALVLRGLDEDAYDTYDLNAKRGVNLTGLVDGRAVDQAQVKAAAVLLWRDLNPQLGHGHKPTPLELRELIAAHPGLAEYRLPAQRMKTFGPPAIWNYLFYKFERQNKTAVTQFIHLMDNPDEIAGTNHPLRLLRARLLSWREDKTRSADRHKVRAEIERVWPRFVAYMRKR